MDTGHAQTIALCCAESGARASEKRFTTRSWWEPDAVAIQPPSWDPTSRLPHRNHGRGTRRALPSSGLYALAARSRMLLPVDGSSSGKTGSGAPRRAEGGEARPVVRGGGSQVDRAEEVAGKVGPLPFFAGAVAAIPCHLLIDFRYVYVCAYWKL
ncbi:hypothetical protein ZWY2020_026239 [Hordeum vulgare]|nr:hypothetical protein ZWY2020_026239 [Hordeum vulgare]